MIYVDIHTHNSVARMYPPFAREKEIKSINPENENESSEESNMIRWKLFMKHKFFLHSFKDTF